MKFIETNVFDTSSCEKINNIRLILLNGARAKVDSSWGGKSNTLEFSRLYYIVDGKANIIYRGKTIELLPKRWYLIPTGLTFDYSCPEYLDHYFLHIKMIGHNGFDLLQAFPCLVEISVNEATTQKFLNSFSNELSYGLRVRNTVWQILLDAIDEYSVKIKDMRFSECVENAIKYINENLSISLTVDEIAEHSLVSKSTLSKAFRSELSTSVCEYLSDRVLTEAKLHIEYEKTPIGDISDSLGFSDRFYFSRKFKQKYGISPRECRKRSSFSAIKF